MNDKDENLPLLDHHKKCENKTDFFEKSVKSNKSSFELELESSSNESFHDEDKENISLKDKKIVLKEKNNSLDDEKKEKNLCKSIDCTVDTSNDYTCYQYTPIEELSFAEKSFFKSYSLKNLITGLLTDEILFDKHDLSKHLNESDKEKFIQIIKVIKQENSEKKIAQLKELCISERGLIINDLRRIVWPLITDLHHINLNNIPSEEKQTSHSMYNQVVLDVTRAIKRFPPSIEHKERLSKEKQLIELIMRVLIENPQFYYYQGYHDICITFLLILGEEKAFHILNKISNTHLSYFLKKTMDDTQLLLELIPIIIEKEDEVLSIFLKESEVGNIFSLSWVLTWFSHILVNNQNVERLFDIFIVCDFRLPIYLTISILLDKRNEILEVEKDMAMVYQCLLGLLDDEDELPLEDLLRKSRFLMEKHPPNDLWNEQKIRRKKQEEKDQMYKKARNKQNKAEPSKTNFNKFAIATTAVVLVGVTIQLYRSNYF